MIGRINWVVFFILCSGVAISQVKKDNEKHIDSIKVHQLEESVVTATRAKRQLSSLPLVASIISKKELQSINSVRLSDVLSEQTGLIMTSEFGSEGVQLQGLDSQYTLILIDGVPLIGRSAGTLDLNRMSVGNIKQIEIVKGASSSLYGNEALGGVINIITENPSLGLDGNASYRVGTFNSHDLSSTVNYKKNKFGITFFANRYSSDGFDLVGGDLLNTVEPFSKYTFNSKISYDISKNTELHISGRYYFQNQDNISQEATIRSNSVQGKLMGKSIIDEWNSHIKVNFSFSELVTTYFEFYATQYMAEEYLNDASGSLFDENFFDQILVRPEWRVSFNPNNYHSLMGGVGYEYRKLDKTNFFGSPEFKLPYAYIQYDTFPIENMNIIAGLRYDSHNMYRTQFSPKLAIRYDLGKLAIKGSVGYGFKTPDFRQLFFDYTNATIGYTILGYNVVQTKLQELQRNGEIANLYLPLSNFEDELNPESSISYNLGVDFTLKKNFKVNLNFFQNTITNLIEARVIAKKTNGQDLFSYFNISSVYTRGLELNTSWNPKKNLTFAGGFQYLIAKDKNAEENIRNGEVFVRETGGISFLLKESDYFGLFNRSKYTANFKVFYAIERWKTDINIRGVYRSKYGLVDTNGNNYLDKYDAFVEGFTIWDTAINKLIYKDFKIALGVDNFLNFKNPQNISNIPGRIIYAKFNINF